MYEEGERFAERYVAPAIERFGLGYGEARETARALAPLVTSLVVNRRTKGDSEDEIGAFLTRHYGNGVE